MLDTSRLAALLFEYAAVALYSLSAQFGFGCIHLCGCRCCGHFILSINTQSGLPVYGGVYLGIGTIYRGGGTAAAFAVQEHSSFISAKKARSYYTFHFMALLCYGG